MDYSNSDLNRRARKPRRRQYEKVAVKDTGIDHQIHCLHELIADKCIANPTLFDDVLERVEMRYAAKQMRYGAYLTWLVIIELKDRPEEFKQALLDQSVKMRKMRRKTVFTQILTEQERLDVIDAIALASHKDAQ